MDCRDDCKAEGIPRGDFGNTNTGLAESVDLIFGQQFRIMPVQGQLRHPVQNSFLAELARQHFVGNVPGTEAGEFDFLAEGRQGLGAAGLKEIRGDLATDLDGRIGKFFDLGQPI